MSRFQIIRKLGEGGMATVHLAREEGQTRLIALKQLKRRALFDPEHLSLFLREVRVASQFSHPGVVQVYEAGVEDDRPFLSLEYVDGPDLDTVIDALYRARERLSPALVAYIGLKVCQALAYVFQCRDEHGQPVITAHRDISPSNVLLTSSGQVKLADFGVVRLSTSATAVGIVKGKWEYFPPEIMTGRPQDLRGDLFALGITLYKLYALAHPFTAPTPQEHFQRARTEDPERPAELPDLLWTALQGALQRDPARRHQTPEAFGRALEAAILESGEPIGSKVLAARIRELPLAHGAPQEHLSLDDEPSDPGLDDPDDENEPTMPDVLRLLSDVDRRSRGLPTNLADDDAETTETGVPNFVERVGLRSAGRASTGIMPTPVIQLPPGIDKLYEELRGARRAAGLVIDITLAEFQHLLNSRQQEILKTKPGARVRFEIGVRNGKPVVIPKVSRH